MWRLRKKKMNKLFLPVLFVITNCVYAQNCKYETNEIDNATKKVNKVTKEITAWRAFNDEAEIQFAKKGESYSLSIVCMIFVVKASTYEGCYLIFQLENGKEIALKKGKINYAITKDQLSKMLTSKVVKIRYQYGTNVSDSKSYERDVKLKWAEDIIDGIKCVY